MPLSVPAGASAKARAFGMPGPTVMAAAASMSTLVQKADNCGTPSDLVPSWVVDGVGSQSGKGKRPARW